MDTIYLIGRKVATADSNKNNSSSQFAKNKNLKKFRGKVKLNFRAKQMIRG